MKVIIVCGPTGSGKSDFAMKLAEKFGGEIINADSRQIYRRLDIGTAKPTIDDRNRIRHHLIDITDISDDFTAKRYAELARAIIIGLLTQGKMPIIVGGAGLYLEALTRGLFDGPARNENYREILERNVEEKSLMALHGKLASIDPESAIKISPGDKTRIIRALEVYNSTGKTMTWMKNNGNYMEPVGEFNWLGLQYSRDELYRRIDNRVDRMIDNGLVNEVKSLIADGLGKILRLKKVVGYYEIIMALEGQISLGDAILLIKQHSRNYAKRQLTWFNNRACVNWLNPNEIKFYDKVFKSLDEYLKKA